MADIDEIMIKLTHDGKYATDVCLFLYLDEHYTSLHYLDYLNITGKDLENLAHKCLPIEESFEYLTDTIRFLRAGFLGEDEIFDNLRSDNPISFIDISVPESGDWDITYENYAGKFRSNLRKNKGRSQLFLPFYLCLKL